MAAYSEKDDAGWFHGILRGEENAPMVEAPRKGRVFGTSYGEVPFEKVVLYGVRANALQWF